MADLRSLIPGDRKLTAEEDAKIQELQDEIDVIWSKRGDYKIDEDAWKHMPLFMENITEEDVAKNEECAAVASIVYDEVPPEELAENRKKHGNECLVRAMNPEQVNKDNMARAAVHCYTEGIDAARDKTCDTKIVAQLYSNRSAAHFIMGNYGHALQDAQSAVLLDSSYAKAYYRGAKAAERTRKYAVGISLVDKGLECLGTDESVSAQREELFALRARIEKGAAATVEGEKKKRLKARVAKAETGNLLRAISSHGVQIAPAYEVGKEMLSQYEVTKPYFGAEEGELHIPILFIYDEFKQSDFMQDVSTMCCPADLLEELMPFPWLQNGTGGIGYTSIKDIVVVFKIDDGVAVPTYHAVDLGWPLIEIMRQPTYKMPMLLPVLHIISRNSTDLIKAWGLEGKIPE